MTLYRTPLAENFSWQQPVESKVTQPVGGEAKGYRYLITVGTGDFTGYSNYIATAKQVNPSAPSHWYFDAPFEAMMTYVNDENTFYVYTTVWAIFAVASSESSQSVDKEIDQVSHGFVVGNVVRFNGSIYVKAQANNGTNSSNVLGLVSNVESADTFTIRCIGWVGGLSGLTAGLTYFLSSDTAGALTATEPTASGTISKPMLIAVSTTSGFIFVFRNVPGTVFSLLVRDTGGDLKPLDDYFGQLGLLELNSDDDLTPSTESLNDTLLELDENNAVMPKV
jgi:hypothetical protein